MSKAFLCYNIDGNSLIKGLVNQGVLLKFASGGRYMGEFPISYGINNPIEIDIISFLSCVEGVEIGLNVGEVFVKFTVEKSISELLYIMNNSSGVIFSGVREGKIGDIDYSQYIYAFKRGLLDLNKAMEAFR